MKIPQDTYLGDTEPEIIDRKMLRCLEAATELDEPIQVDDEETESLIMHEEMFGRLSM